jgi:methionine salvage enolase-phosphatase E1
LKLESESYKRIAEQINCAPENILFLTDNIKGFFIQFLNAECIAAREAGLLTKNVKRPGNPEVPDLQDVDQIESFLNIC